MAMAYLMLRMERAHDYNKRYVHAFSHHQSFCTRSIARVPGSQWALPSPTGPGEDDHNVVVGSRVASRIMASRTVGDNPGIGFMEVPFSR